jgi:hypothetical protein
LCRCSVDMYWQVCRVKVHMSFTVTTRMCRVWLQDKTRGFQVVCIPVQDY